jgi:FtsH-binding integral membrane protein
MNGAADVAHYAAWIVATAFLAGAVVLAVAQRTIAAEMERRAGIRDLLPALRKAWRVVGSSLIVVGAMWLLHTAQVVDLAGLRRYGPPAVLMLVGAILVYLYRPARSRGTS